MTQTASTNASEKEVARGRRCPPLPPQPDLGKVEFGEPIEMFNGRDLTGWRLQPAGAQRLEC